MRITHTYSPVEVHTRQLLDLNDPDTGTLAVSMRPGSKDGSWVYRDLLAAMGQDRDYAAARTGSVADDRIVCKAYLHAHAIRRVVVVHCEWARLRARDEGLVNLHELATAHDLDLDLVSELDQNTTAPNWVTAAGGQLLDWDPQRFQLPPSSESGPRYRFTFPPEVPHVDFPLFRATCRRLLSPAEFTQVDTAYLFAFRSARAILSGEITEAEAVEFLRVQLAAVVNPAQAVTIIRACQAAAFANGLLLRIDLGSLGYFIANGAHRQLTMDELRLVRRVHAPWKAAAVVLTDAGLAVDQLLAMHIDDVDDTGAILTGDLRSVLRDEARLHLRALRFQRLDEESRSRGAATTRLFTARHVAVRTQLYGVRRELAIPLNIPRWRTIGRKDPIVADLRLNLRRIRPELAA